MPGFFMDINDNPIKMYTSEYFIMLQTVYNRRQKNRLSNMKVVICRLPSGIESRCFERGYE